MARAGPEPSTLYLLPLSLTERLQPAYCEPRQASTGWLVCTVTTNGHADEGSVVSSDTRPRPPRQISPRRRPASSPPRVRTPQSIRVSPRGPCATSTRNACASRISASTIGTTSRLTLGHLVSLRASRVSSFITSTLFTPC